MRDMSEARAPNALPMILFGLAMALCAGLAVLLSGGGLLAAFAAYACAGFAAITALGTLRAFPPPAFPPRARPVALARRLAGAFPH